MNRNYCFWWDKKGRICYLGNTAERICVNKGINIPYDDISCDNKTCHSDLLFTAIKRDEKTIKNLVKIIKKLRNFKKLI